MRFSKEDREYYDKLLEESRKMQIKNGNKTYTHDEVVAMFKNLYKRNEKVLE